MPYPSKTDRQAILSAAIRELAHGSIRNLSLRNTAASLGLAPNAIYRYFSDRRALEAAISSEAARQMEVALRKASDGCAPLVAIRQMSSAYMKFARENQSLYEALMGFHSPDHDPTFHESLWAFTVEQVQRITDSNRAAQASVALWAFLHGAVTLEAAQVLGELKPASGLDFGLEAWLEAVSARGAAVQAPQRKPAGKMPKRKVSRTKKPRKTGDWRD